MLYSFTGPPDNGANPGFGVLFDEAGNIYGSTQVGGADKVGVDVELSPSGSGYVESVLYSFAGSPDGANQSTG